MDRWHERREVNHAGYDRPDPPADPEQLRSLRPVTASGYGLADHLAGRVDRTPRLDLPAELKQLDLPREGVPDLGPVRLKVAAVGGGEVEVGGWITPARIVHATRSRDVVVGNNCTLTQTEHHHFDRVTVSLDGVLEDRRVRDALRNLVRDGYSFLGDRAFRAALRQTLIERGGSPDELDLPISGGHANITTRSGVVQVGDGSQLETETPIFVRETVLPGAELLFRNDGLRKTFVAALREPEPTGPQMARFLAEMLRAAECTDQLRLLDFAAESGVYNASVFGIFCFTQVSNAGAVLAGAGNTLIRGVEVDVQEFVGEDIARAVTDLRREFTPETPAVPAPRRWWELGDLRDPPISPPPPTPPPHRPGPGGLW